MSGEGSMVKSKNDLMNLAEIGFKLAVFFENL